MCEYGLKMSRGLVPLYSRWPHNTTSLLPVTPPKTPLHVHVHVRTLTNIVLKSAGSVSVSVPNSLHASTSIRDPARHAHRRQRARRPSALPTHRAQRIRCGVGICTALCWERLLGQPASGWCGSAPTARRRGASRCQMAVQAAAPEPPHAGMADASAT